jgi:hypothetical protein
MGYTARRWLAYAGVLTAAFASIATSTVEPLCPRVTTLAGDADVAPGSVTTKRYHISASDPVELTVFFHATAETASEFRAVLVPAEPTQFRSSDGGASVTQEVAVEAGREVTADFALPSCVNSAGCNDYFVTLTLEHIAGAPAQVTWEITAETQECGEVHTVIEEL